ncbi:hypothetical protein EGW08_017095 [Elysia chlorotica]|uniref:BAAT/Acyl-CoA thioester hydrolase C-terminal domain-containing protein n=1 Tax=Elysia chlorotica TaxID=188477 RepID=A0A3S0ZTV0_ELYCH|nr:hypothetical protein EGW08_017095 [Elysia chlorotica]
MHARRLRQVLICLANAQTKAHTHHASGPRLSLSSDHVMIDEKVQIKADGLNPGQKVTLFASIEEANKLYGSCGHYLADEKGTVDTFISDSRGGTFTGVEPMGLFWSMKSKPGGPDRRLYKKDVMSPYTVSIKVLEGFLNFSDLWGDLDESCLAACQLFRTYSKPGVKRVVVEKDGLYGTLFFPPGEGPFPAVIDMFGFTNESVEFRSALLASHGLASFVVNYIGYKDLPKRDIDLDYNYFLKAFDFLAAHPNVDEKAIGGIATCGGAAFLLLIAFKRPMMKCCVTINGVLFPFGTTQEVEGEIVKGIQLNVKDACIINGKVSMRTVFKPGYEKLILPAWRHGAKMLMIQGLGDKCSEPASLDRLRPLIPDEFSEAITMLTYPGAGHLLEPPYSPHVLSNVNPLLDLHLLWGGEPKLHAKAQEDSWPRILDFFHKNLKTECNKGEIV